MKKLRPIYIATGIILSLNFSCTKEFEKINTNPNTPITAPLTNVLGYVLEDFAANFYNPSTIEQSGSYAGQLSLVQYIGASQYSFGGLDGIWTNAYRDIRNAQSVVDGAKKTSAINMQATATTFQAFIFQIVTDSWRDVPFSMAVKGETGVVTPSYDKQEDIYPKLLTMLKEAGDLFASGATDQLGEGDLLYKGNIDNWRRFCNSLRLRVAMRISNIAPALARSNIEEIANNPSKYPVFETNTQNAYFYWPGSSPYIEPYANRLSYDVYGIAAPLVDTLKALVDPRLSVYAFPASDDGEYRGVEVGPVGQVAAAHYSRIGARFRNDLKGFSPFMNAAEVKFIYAEASANGWNVGMNVQNYYDDGITLSMNENGITSAPAITAYLQSSPVKWNGNAKKINIQKWISLYKQNFEAWAESRRTDVPLLSAAAGSIFPGHNRPPFRLPYPDSESTLNGNNSGPFVSEVRDRLWGKQMWWDTRTGVK